MVAQTIDTYKPIGIYDYTHTNGKEWQIRFERPINKEQAKKPNSIRAYTADLTKNPPHVSMIFATNIILENGEAISSLQTHEQNLVIDDLIRGTRNITVVDSFLGQLIQ
ncbi:MAG: hypothetical protein K940chlam5_00024 [Candidatus Anoxychlamydiales bacterium]|nr:hypothetical protein [Candidatus Anoxychlamydiales bacterium]